MLVVAGSFEVDPERRDDFIASREEGMRTSRAEQGCHEYVMAADPLVAGRVVLYERWEDKAALAAHLAAQQAQRSNEGEPADAVPVLAMEIVQYEISSIGPLGS